MLSDLAADKVRETSGGVGQNGADDEHDLSSQGRTHGSATSGGEPARHFDDFRQTFLFCQLMVFLRGDSPKGAHRLSLDATCRPLYCLSVQIRLYRKLP